MRQQELCELEQAASELRKALERAQQRLARRPVPPLMPQHLQDVIKAIYFVERSLQTLADAHPGDSHQELAALIAERSELRGWEAWTNLIREQLDAQAAELRAEPQVEVEVPAGRGSDKSPYGLRHASVR